MVKLEPLVADHAEALDVAAAEDRRSSWQATRRIVDSLGGTTCPVSGYGTACTLSSTSRSALAAHWAAAVNDSNPAQAKAADNTPSTREVADAPGTNTARISTARSAISSSSASSEHWVPIRAALGNR